MSTFSNAVNTSNPRISYAIPRRRRRRRYYSRFITAIVKRGSQKSYVISISLFFFSRQFNDAEQQQRTALTLKFNQKTSVLVARSLPSATEYTCAHRDLIYIRDFISVREEVFIGCAIGEGKPLCVSSRELEDAFEKPINFFFSYSRDENKKQTLKARSIINVFLQLFTASLSKQVSFDLLEMEKTTEFSVLPSSRAKESSSSVSEIKLGTLRLVRPRFFRRYQLSMWRHCFISIGCVDERSSIGERV